MPSQVSHSFSLSRVNRNWQQVDGHALRFLKAFYFHDLLFFQTRNEFKCDATLAFQYNFTKLQVQLEAKENFGSWNRHCTKAPQTQLRGNRHCPAVDSTK